MIQELAVEDCDLHSAYLDVKNKSEHVTHFLRASGRYPFTGQGDVNTYSVFAETFRDLIDPTGSAGILTPTGLATDKTTASFFGSLVKRRALSVFHDFVTNPKIWSDVGNRKFRFAVSAMRGRRVRIEEIRMSFFSKHPLDIVPERVFVVSPEEIALVNPNTGNCPTFLTRQDAEIALRMYRRHPVVMLDGAADGNPWKLSFARLFDLATDSHLFHQKGNLDVEGFDGWAYEVDGTKLVPLYEGKMLWHFDHRLSSYALRAEGSRDTELPRLDDEMHKDPRLEAGARYWVNEVEVKTRLGSKWDRDWVLGWRDITGSALLRTFVPSVLPTSAVGDSFLLALPAEPAEGPFLHAVWSSLAFDYVARQKLSGVHMKYFVAKQLACPTPDAFAVATPWQPEISLGDWVRSYVLELSYTSWRLRSYANEMGDDGPPFHWDSDRRAFLRADLDAAFLHVYGLTKQEADHVLSSFGRLQRKEDEELGEFRTRRLVLEAYDRMAAAIARGGTGWSPLADIPAGHGPRHPA